MKTKIFKIICIFFILNIFIFINSLGAAQNTTVSIPLIYPQNSNAPKRELKKQEKPVVLKGEVLINITGISSEQLKSPDLYVEYFLDDDLVYSTQDKNQDKTKENLLSFILDTTKYADGNHKLVINLWDLNEPSAIGIREIIIQNEAQTK